MCLGLDLPWPVTEAKVALARKLAVIMHRMLVDGTPFNHAAGAAAA